jgi:hypothetical protein
MDERTWDGLEKHEVDVAVGRLGQEGRLPHVLQHQARVDQTHERNPYGRSSEMAKISIHGFCSCN